ncbi:MAG: ABC transporter ATP-binding protein [Anaerolineae bacterium]|nr:ABC transporter ATP-binding protein [Anaerolineae bacterium]
MFMGLDKDRYDRQYSDSYLFKRLWQYFGVYKGRIAVVTVSGIFLSLALALTPILIAVGVDALETNATDNFIFLIVLALGAVSITEFGTNWLRRRAVGRLVGGMIADLRKDAFDAAIARDMAFYDENKTGKVLSRVTNDTEDFGQTLIVATEFISQIVQVLFLLVILLNRDVMLTLVVLGFLVPVMGVTLIFRVLARRTTRRGSRAMAEVNDNIQETVTGISVAKNFRQEQNIYNQFEAVNQQSYRVNLQRGGVIAAIFPVLNALAGFGIALVLYIGAQRVVDGVMIAAVWLLYLRAVDAFWFPVINLSSYWSQFQQALASTERIFALIDAENTVKQTANEPVTELQGHLAFKDLRFAYRGQEWVLDGFDLDIAPGESIALVGHTGAGKSSIVKLILRLYEFQGGEIRVDGHDIRRLNLYDYRHHIGFVPQVPFLFSGTVADNIRFSKPEATDAEVEAIAYSIGQGEWLEALPDGLQTDVGERGSRLSIGQRQLVSLLRVLLQRPRVFILDEATASVDNFTEVQIQEALNLILKQSTSVMIAHRLSTVRSADRIIVLRQGQIIEQGNHNQLISQGGYYAELYNTYFRHQSLSYVEQSRQMFAAD